MNIQLIQGEFSANDAIGIINEMIGIKIKYHENKIQKLSNEEDIKAREEKIKRLQQERFELRNELLGRKGTVHLDSVIHIG
jgi:hypothetical protein